QIEEERRHPRARAQRSRDEAVARAVTAAAAPVGEEDDPARADRDREIALQADVARGDGGQPVEVVELVTEAHGVAPLARPRSARTSSSVVSEKSSYQRPTAWSGSGVRAQITSSTTLR